MYMPMQLVDEADIAHADSLFRVGFERRVKDLAHMPWDDRVHAVLGDLWHVCLKVMVAVAIVVVGRWLIKRAVRMISSMFDKWKVDHSLRTFIRSAAKTLLYFVLFYIVIAWLGVNTSLFVALFAAAGLAVGMAMSGVFQNLAGGVMVLVLKPFRCGDWVELQGQAGRVMDIRLFSTVLRTADNRTVLMPNGGVSTSIVVNNFSARTRRLEWAISLDLGVDLDAVSRELLEILTSDGRVGTLPKPEVLVNRIDDNSIDLLIRGWVASPDYWDVLFAIYAQIYRQLPAHGFSLTSGKSIEVTINNSADNSAQESLGGAD